MQVMMNYLRLAPARFATNRALVAAMLLGPIIGAMVAVATVAAEDAPKGAPNEVIIDNFVFTPKELTVAVGTTIKWVNHDDIPHSVVEKNKTTFRSKALDTDDSFTYTFAAAGTFDYFCGLHPHMVGQIIVK
jgi:plastocyanin